MPGDLPRLLIADKAVAHAGGRATSDWRIALARLEGAYSESTLRAYRANFAKFETWCLENAREPLPAAPEAVASFVDDNAPSFSSATLRQQIASIRKVHCLLRLESPVDDEDVQIALRRAYRRKPRRQRQARGLTCSLRDQLIAACPTTLQGLRNRALIAAGYGTLCRRSELVALRVEDLEDLDGGAMSILIQRAKNDQFGDGRYGYLTPRTAKTLKGWLAAVKISSGWIFRPVFGPTIGSAPLHAIAVNRVLKSAALAAGCTAEVIQSLSGHSMRVGAAQDLMAAGAGLLPIMRAGGWKSMNVIGRYVEHAEISALGKLRR